MIPWPRVLRTSCRGGVLAWRSSSCSPFVQPADGESPTLFVFLFPPCIPPVVASVPTLDVFAASFRSRGRWGSVLYRLRLTSVFALHLQRCHVGFELFSMTALAMGLFARRPPLVVPRSRFQPPPLKPPWATFWGVSNKLPSFGYSLDSSWWLRSGLFGK